MVKHLKFTAMVMVDDEVQIAAGIIMNCPSEDALREKLEGDMGALVISMEEATADEIEAAEDAKEE